VCSKCLQAFNTVATDLTQAESFAHYIKMNIFTVQRPAAFCNPRESSLFCSILPQLLECRLTKRSGSPSLLPDLVLKILDIFVQAANNDTVAQRKMYTKAICAEIPHIRHSVVIKPFALQPSAEMELEYKIRTGREEALVIAMAMKDHPLITQLFAAGLDVWG
jgi:hypothetical protein